MNILIQAVPWDSDRLARANEIAKETYGEVIWDVTRSGFETLQRVLERAGDEPVLIIEDDVELCEDFIYRVEEVIESHSDEVVHFFSVHDIPAGRYPGRTFEYTQCFYLPAGDAASLLEFSKTWRWQGRHLRADQDMLVRDWLGEREYWIEAPSLVQHEPWPSVTALRRNDRRSPTFRSRCGSDSR